MYTKLRAELKIDLRRTFSNMRRRVYGTAMWWPNKILGGVPQKSTIFHDGMADKSVPRHDTARFRHHDVQ